MDRPSERPSKSMYLTVQAGLRVNSITIVLVGVCTTLEWGLGALAELALCPSLAAAPSLSMDIGSAVARAERWSGSTRRPYSSHRYLRSVYGNKGWGCGEGSHPASQS